MSAGMLQGNGPDEVLFAAFDEASRYCSPQTCAFNFSATLAPYRSEAEARAALEAAGCISIQSVGRAK